MNRLLVEKIDTNNDGFVELEELNQWIKNVTNKNIMKEVETRWHTLENNNSLEAYLEFNYASLKLCKNRLAFLITQSPIVNTLHFINH